MFKGIKKYVINLKRRPERLELMWRELEYMGLENIEIFEGIDLKSHEGCAFSHLEIIKTAKKESWDRVIVFEDDIIFMPYAKSLISDIEKELQNLNFGTLNLNPSLHRPLEVSKESHLLLDITNKPPKQPNHRGVFGTGFMVYDKSVYDDMMHYDKIIAIDEFLENVIYNKHQSYSPIIPICCQRNNFSDVSGDFYRNFFTQSYNWNVYSPHKLPNKFLEEQEVLNMRGEEIDYKTIITH